MVEIEFVKRTRVNGWWILPGSRAEFATAGQAGTFTVGGAAKRVDSKPKRKTATKPKSKDGAGSKAGDVGGSETDVPAKSE